MQSLRGTLSNLVDGTFEFRRWRTLDSPRAETRGRAQSTITKEATRQLPDMPDMGTSILFSKKDRPDPPLSSSKNHGRFFEFSWDFS
jgi:hypothetical protein